MPQPPPPPPNLSAPAGLFLPNSTTLIVSSAQVPPISGASASATYTNAGGVNPIKVLAFYFCLKTEIIGILTF